MKTVKESKHKILKLKKESISILNPSQLAKLVGGDTPPATLSTVSVTNTSSMCTSSSYV